MRVGFTLCKYAHSHTVLYQLDTHILQQTTALRTHWTKYVKFYECKDRFCILLSSAILGCFYNGVVPVALYFAAVLVYSRSLTEG